MIALNFRADFASTLLRLDALPDEVRDKVVARALNKTIDQGKAQMARQISQEFRIGVAQAKQRLYVTYARAKGKVTLQVILEAKRAYGLGGAGEHRGMGLINFVENVTTLAQARKRAKRGEQSQVFFQVKRGGGKKFIRGAFIATNRKTGGTALFVREGKARYPINVRTTIDIPQMFNTRRVNEVMVKVMRDKFVANFDREYAAAAKGFLK